jgi:hypothetical protein
VVGSSCFVPGSGEQLQTGFEADSFQAKRILLEVENTFGKDSKER